MLNVTGFSGRDRKTKNCNYKDKRTCDSHWETTRGKHQQVANRRFTGTICGRGHSSAQVTCSIILPCHFDLPWFGYVFIWSVPYVCSMKEPEVDRHPERRMKAAFTAYEEANMARIKSENPTLRMSQLKQILRKEWMRSPENPLNQQMAS